MGLSPSLWGRQAWHFIHIVSLNYPNKPTDEDKDNYLAFFKSLRHILPCPICAKHFEENMEKLPIRLENTKDLFEWTVDIHNEVNKSNGKIELSYEEALKEINRNIMPKVVYKQNYAPIVLSVIAAGVVVFIGYKIVKNN
jgi:hypothetical protein